MTDRSVTKQQCPFDGNHFSPAARAACEACNPERKGVQPGAERRATRSGKACNPERKGVLPTERPASQTSNERGCEHPQLFIQHWRIERVEPCLYCDRERLRAALVSVQECISHQDFMQVRRVVSAALSGDSSVPQTFGDRSKTTTGAAAQVVQAGESARHVMGSPSPAAVPGSSDETSALQTERDCLVLLLGNLVRRMDEIHEDSAFQSVWIVNQLHAGPYTGPKYDQQLEAARKYLRSLQGECPSGDYKRAEVIASKDSRSESPAPSAQETSERFTCTKCGAVSRFGGATHVLCGGVFRPAENRKGCV